MTSKHAAALSYAARGWAVFPLMPGSKFPFAGTQAHMDATTDIAVINDWWTKHPDANIGIALAPSGLYVLDVDTGLKKDGTRKRGRETLAKIDDQLPDTLTSFTPRGGLHGIFVRPEGLTPHRHIGILEKDSGLDLLGEGYIVAPPSVFKDPDTGSVGEYKWNRLMEPAPLPPVLLNIAKAPRSTEQVKVTGTPIGEGGRNQALFRLACALRDQGIGAEALARAIAAENKERCTPPLDDAELSLIVNSALQRVTVTRDVALGAQVAQEVRAALAPAMKAKWLADIAVKPAPPMVWYSSGFPGLDALTGGGLATRQICGVIGPPSTGKSAFVGEMLLHLQQYRPVLHFSTELQDEEIMIRTAAHEMAFPWRDGLKGKIPREAMYNAVSPYRIKVLGAEDIDRDDPIGHLYAEAELIRQQTGVTPIVAIDYVQMLARGAPEQVRHKVGELTLALRIMSQRLDTVVIAVFSTGRAFYNPAAVEKMRAARDATSYLVAAKEAGEIEYDCALLTYLDVDKLVPGPHKPAQLAVARCRAGDTGFVGLRAKLDVGRFEEDPSALAELEHSARQAKEQEHEILAMTDRLLDVIRRMPNRPWREMQAALAGTYPMRMAAKNKLIEQRVIAEIPRVGFDENKQKLRGTTLVILEKPPADVRQEGEP